jgi:sodium/bile acid cotransporter 7
VAATICASQKTMALGVPLVSLLFAGQGDLSLLTLPLVLYHALQLTVSGLLAPGWRRWLERPAAAASV